MGLCAQNGFVIVSKDADFHQRSLLCGHPPKFVYLRLGNCPTRRISEILVEKSELLHDFAQRAHEAILILM